MNWIILNDYHQYSDEASSFEEAMAMLDVTEDEGYCIIPEQSYDDLRYGETVNGLVLINGKLIDAEIWDEEACEILGDMNSYECDMYTPEEWIEEWKSRNTYHWHKNQYKRGWWMLNEQ